MRPGRPHAEHQETVHRRLARLSADLAGQRAAPGIAESEADEEPAEEPGEEPGEEWGEREEPPWWADHTRVRARPAASAVPDPDSVPVARIPIIGRHASRRPREWAWSELVPAGLRGRVALEPAQLTVVAVVVALGLALTCWWVVRAGATEVHTPLAGEVAPSRATTTPGADPSGGLVDLAPSTPAQASGSASVTVDVAGRVRRPGIAVLDAGARVVDALRAAGGARAGVDLTSLNLARVLVDGEQILVGIQAAGGVAASAVSTPGVAGGALVNLNTATEAELESLPEVGPVTAQSILAWREEHGAFTAVDELLEVDGIGDATLAQIAPHVTI